MSGADFMAIPPGAVLPGSMPDFKIYIRSQDGKYILWALKGNQVGAEQLAKLTEGGFQEIYVDLKEKLQYEQYLEDNLGEILGSPWSTGEQKAAIFSKVSANIVKTAFETSLKLGSMGGETLYRTHRMIKNALVFIIQSNSLPALAKMIGHDYQTYTHATKVLWFTTSFLKYHPDILKQIKPAYEEFDEKQLMELLWHCGVGALLHDIGKAFVAQEILVKEGPLNDVEWEIMKRHPLSGLAMIMDADLPDFVKKAILQHHEDFNGSGYPLGLADRNISTLARVLRIVDTFDAITSRRPYKEAMPPGKAIQLMIAVPEEDGSERPDPDRCMRQCFDETLLRKFILFLGNVDLGK